MRYLIIILVLVQFTLSSFAQGVIFYLHGKIVEDHGAHAVDTEHGYGAYQYEDILNVFREKKFTVISEVREKGTNPFDYAHKLAQRIDSCIKSGIVPDQVTVVGASQGAVIAMMCSSYLNNKDVNFVFLAGCNKDILQGFSDIKFCGNILSIYEKTDDIGRSCIHFKNRDAQTIPHYKEIEIHTGLKHGFLYKPMPDWMEPTIKWAANDYK